MKTYLTYGFAMALAGALLTLALFFMGYHNDPAKLQTAQRIGMVVGIAIGFVGISLGTRARRAETPESEPFGYGRALGAGVMVALFSCLLGFVTNYVYMAFINPGFGDIILQAQAADLEAKGMSSAQIEQAEKVTRFFISPLISSAFSMIFGFIFSVIIALITSAFLKRSDSGKVPPVQAA
ncbi:MAG: DUF4199 domain-containing protein [Verrucomicrobia bacterium]|nr:DUF4199 domain-containing protein [Verrucomicrobiota bacterium]